MLPLFLHPLNQDFIEEKLSPLPYKTPADLNTLLQWHTIDFTGITFADFLAFENTRQSLKAIQTDTNRKKGIRIRFLSHATFGSLVAVLDAMYIFNQKYSWLDIKHEPLTLYIITNKVEFQDERVIIQ